MIVFSQEWFSKYNKQICWLANSFLGQFVFKFKKYGHYTENKIVKITPNSVGEVLGVKGNKVEIKEHFFGRNEYALRLQKVFYPIWITFHTWDMLIANNFKPAWNLGFDTLTVYPDADPESTSMDAHVLSLLTNETWDNVHTGTTTTSSDDSPALLLTISPGSSSDTWNRIYRTFTLFDTSALTSGVTVSNAVLSIYGYDKYDDTTVNPTINVYATTPASNTAIADSDFNNIGTVAQCDTAITYAGFSTTGYNDFTLNATGIGNVSKTGISKFGLREVIYDVADSAPTWNASLYVQFASRSADHGSDKPKLVVTYTTTVDTTMIVTVGAFTLTGIATTFLKSLNMLVSNGAFSLTGIDTALKIGRKMTTAVGTFVLTGIDIVFLFGKRLIAEVGAFTLTGIDTTFKIALSMPTAVGEFVLTGKDTLLKIGRKMAVAVGAFALTGIDVMFCLGKGMVVSVGAFILTGKNVTLKRVATMVTSVGSFVLSGKSVRLLLNGSIVQWINQVKNSASYTNKSKNTSIWTNQTKSDR